MDSNNTSLRDIEDLTLTPCHCSDAGATCAKPTKASCTRSLHVSPVSSHQPTALPPTTTYDVIIVGAGVIGCALARELSKYPLKTLVLESSGDVATGASKANSGIIHGGYNEKHGTLKGRLAHAGNQLFASLDADLHFGFRVVGSLVVAYRDEEKAKLEAILENGRKNGVEGLRVLGREEIVKIEPKIHQDVKWALHCPHTGVTTPFEYAIALAENAIVNGVEIRLGHQVVGIERVRKDEDFVVMAKAKNQPHTEDFETVRFRGRFVINCAGLYSDKVAAMVGVNDFRIIPRIGEYILLDKSQAECARHTIFPLPTDEGGKGILVSQTYWGNLLLGPTSRPQNDHQTNAEILRSILQSAHHSIPDIDVRKAITSFTGMRAKSDRGDFIIEESRTKGFVNVAGIDSPGLTSSPAVAKMVVEILDDMITVRSGGRATQPGAPLQTLRAKSSYAFHSQRLPIVIAKTPEILRGCRIDHPSPQMNIVCRCERVLESEIVDVMHRPLPARSVDTIRRRTRAGMGTCQGTFCEPRVVALVAREFGVSEEEVPRRGAGSSLLPHRRVTEEDGKLLEELEKMPGVRKKAKL